MDPFAVMDEGTPKKVHALHEEFHAAAAAVLELALAGKKQEAEKAMAPGSQYASISQRLKQEMTRWKESLAG